MQGSARRIQPQRRGNRRWLLVTAAAVAALLLWWLFGSSDQAAPDARRGAGDPAWDQAYDGLLNGGQAARTPGGIVVQGATLGRALGEGLIVTPRQTQGVTAGYVIAPASDPAVLAQAKLRPGDVLIDVDGRPLDADRLRALADELAPADAVELTFERQGQIRNLVVDLSR